MLHIYVCIQTARIRRTSGRNLGTFKQNWLSPISGKCFMLLFNLLLFCSPPFFLVFMFLLCFRLPHLLLRSVIPVVSYSLQGLFVLPVTALSPLKLLLYCVTSVQNKETQTLCRSALLCIVLRKLQMTQFLKFVSSEDV
jgi:hypothetical protein